MKVPSATLSVQMSPAVHFSSLQFQQPDTEEKRIPSCHRPLALVAQTCLDMSSKVAGRSVHVSGVFQVIVVFDIETAEWTHPNVSKQAAPFFHDSET